MKQPALIPIAKPLIGEEEKYAVLEVLDSGILAQGPRVAAFEAAFAEMCGVKYAVATNSGTAALHLALLSHGIGIGDEVILPSFTFIATAHSILYTGARPVFVDIDPHTFNVAPKAIEKAITQRTKAILPVHLFGLCCDMESILPIARKYQLAVIEDACQSHGAELNGKRAGSFGTGTFSLYPTKNMTSAEGGMITTNSQEIYEHCRMIRQQGSRKRDRYEILGFNFRMTDVHAAIGLEQLRKLPKFNASRQANARFLSERLHRVLPPFTPSGYTHVFHQYTVRVPEGRRDALREHLREWGIASEIYYPTPLHKQESIKQLVFTANNMESPDIPQTDQACEEVLSLPVHPGLSLMDLERIVESVNTFFSQS